MTHYYHLILDKIYHVSNYKDQELNSATERVFLVPEYLNFHPSPALTWLGDLRKTSVSINLCLFLSITKGLNWKIQNNLNSVNFDDPLSFGLENIFEILSNTGKPCKIESN